MKMTGIEWGLLATCLITLFLLFGGLIAVVLKDIKSNWGR